MSNKAKRKLAQKPAQRVEVPDPFSRDNMRQVALRLGLPLMAVWIIGGCIAGISQSHGTIVAALAIPGVITVLLAGILVWGVGQARKTKSVAGLLSKAETAEDRKAALEKLDQDYGKKDPAAVFAKAQLFLQDNEPRKALEVLEQIELGKVLAPVADEARAQRAMIHLLIGEVTPARDLADGIDLSRQQDAKARAMMASVVAEAWARTGQARKAAETIELFNPDDPEFEPIRAQLYRARAYVFAATGDAKGMRRALKKLIEQDARLLGGFMTKRTHPLLQKEAKKMLEQSGQAPRKMIMQRH